MFSLSYEDVLKKFPSAIIFQARFRGAHHYVLTPGELLTTTDEEKAGPKTTLGEAMRDLYYCTWTTASDQPICDGVVEKTLKIIEKERRIENIEEQYKECKKIAKERDQIKLYPHVTNTLNTELNNFWAVTQQLRFGLLLREVLFKYNISSIKLDPVFGSLLNPTGGILGVPDFWLHSLTVWQDGPLNYNVVCKDVYWYLKTYHKFELGKDGLKYCSILNWYWIDMFVNKFATWH